MRLIEAFFIVALPIWLSMPLIYFLLLKLNPGMKLTTAQNKASCGGNCKPC